MDNEIIELLDRARELRAANQPNAAMASVRAALRAEPGHLGAKALLVDIVNFYPADVDADTAPLILRLLRDPGIDPVPLNRAGWALLRREDGSFESAESEIDLKRLAGRLDDDEMALTLLQESPVGDRLVEKSLTRLRRWLLVSGRWLDYPVLVSALAAQASLNGGAWPFDGTEQDLLVTLAGTPIRNSYLPDLPVQPSRPAARSGEWVDGVTGAVAAQYEQWPYPVWRRLTMPTPRRLPEFLRKFEPAADAIPVEADVLVAGCGTGREAARIALEYPDAKVTAIDLSESSLNYARRQCAAVGAPAIHFRQLDLHDASELNMQFDAIFCSGVLHHLPDPEAGWAVLNALLKPGGVMQIAVYSRIARAVVERVRSFIGDLLDEPPSDDLLRRVRDRVLTHSNPPAHPTVLNAPDFSTLAGTRDFLLHAHEDPFDVPRIARALDRFGLRLLHFTLPTATAEARYNAMFPDDPLHQNFGSWKLYEFLNPLTFMGCYQFWCRKSVASGS